MFRAKKKLFVDINFARRKTRELDFSKFFKDISSVKTGNVLYIISGISFAGIFMVSFGFKYLLQVKQENIRKLNEKIYMLQYKLKRLRTQMEVEQRKFSEFYIPSLKEKLFYLLFVKGYLSSIKTTIEKFENITQGINAYTGFTIYPNIYNIKSTGVVTNFYNSTPRVIYRSFKKIFKNKNPFKNPEKLSAFVVNTPMVFIEKPNIDSSFYKALQNIKTKELRANLLLEYLLTTKDINRWSFKVPVTIIFPLNVVFPDEKTYKVRFKQLKNFCNYLIINKEYNETIYINNKLRIKTVVDGICIKNIY